MLDLQKPKISLSYFVREPKDLDDLVDLSGFGIQLGFNTFNELDLKNIKHKLDELGILVNSLHPPKIVSGLYDKLSLLKKLFDIPHVTLHPTRERLEDVKFSLSYSLRKLEEEGLKVGFENLKKTGSWLRNPYDILYLPQHFKLTLDFRHLPNNLNELDVFQDLRERLLVLHLSQRNSKQNQPYDGFPEFLPFYLASPCPELVLEYGRNNIIAMKRDYNALIRLLGEYHNQAAVLETRK